MDTWTTLLILRSYHCWNLKLVGHHLIHYHWHTQQKHHNIHNCHISGFCKSAVFLNGRKNVWDTMCLLWRPTRGEDADFADKLFLFVFYPHIVFTKNCFFLFVSPFSMFFCRFLLLIFFLWPGKIEDKRVCGNISQSQLTLKNAQNPICSTYLANSKPFHSNCCHPKGETMKHANQ